MPVSALGQAKEAGAGSSGMVAVFGLALSHCHQSPIKTHGPSPLHHMPDWPVLLTFHLTQSQALLLTCTRQVQQQAPQLPVSRALGGLGRARVPHQSPSS
jgi:hypothetical protein